MLPRAWKRCISAKYTRPSSTLSGCSQNRQPYCTFSGLGDCPNTISCFLSRALKRRPLLNEAWHKWTCLWHIGAECGH